MPRHRFVALDALRGVAAFIVIFRHISLDGLPNPWYSSFLAVDFFFLLSGFVLEPTLPSTRGSEPTYLLNRVIRLWPAYLIGFFLLFCERLYSSDYASVSEMLNDLLLGTLILPNLHSSSTFVFFLPPAWSLFAEFWVANILFVSLYKEVGTRGTMAIVILSGLCLFVLGIYHGNLDIGFTHKSVYASAPKALFSFGLGCLLRHYSPVKTTPLGVGAFLAVCAVFIALLALPQGAAPIAVQLFIIVIAFPLLLLLGSRVRLNGYVGSAAEALGIASYPMYILHPGLSFILAAIWVRLHAHLPYQNAIAVCVITMLSWVFAEFVDRPLRRFLADRTRAVRIKPTFSENRSAGG